MLVGCLLLVPVLLIATSLGAMYLFSQSNAGASTQSLGFGTGGSECELANVADSFTVGETIRFVAAFEPELPAGATVTVSIERDGTELTDLGDSVTFEDAVPCFSGTVPASEPGQYRVVFEIDPSTMPPLVGELDVTP